MFEFIIELFRIKKTLKEKQDELHSLEGSIVQRLNESAEIERQLDEKSKILQNHDAEIEKLKQEAIRQNEDVLTDYKNKIETSTTELENIQVEQEKTQKKLTFQTSRLQSLKTLTKAVRFAIDNYDITQPYTALGLSKEQYDQLDELLPAVILPLESDDIKDLRQQNRENAKRLEEVLEKFKKRYTTKSNQAIYQLMVVALRAELQNILTTIKYDKLDTCLQYLNDMIGKYLKIASDGSQTIAPTLNKFIAQIHVIFEDMIKVEYEYYVRKEQARAEQQALREQMRQEAEERKALEQQQKQVEKEESKYKTEIDNMQQQLNNCDDDTKRNVLLARIKELENQLARVKELKEEIIKRQNGKAGYVYVISNLGSFGDHTFKVGMTRRLDPMERVRELSAASVPFSFDVHSFIFSDDAVGLEAELHRRLNSKRKNKINLRKEFFDSSIEELEKLVQEINPSAEFKRTMLATEYRRSQSM